MVSALTSAWTTQCLACTARGSKKDGGKAKALLLQTRRRAGGGKGEVVKPRGGVPIKWRPPVHAQSKWGQQLRHERDSGLFYCHLKTTFKNSIISAKKKKEKRNRTKEMGPFLTVLWNMSLGLPGLKVPTSGQHKPPGHPRWGCGLCICPMERRR